MLLPFEMYCHLIDCHFPDQNVFNILCHHRLNGFKPPYLISSSWRCMVTRPDHLAFLSTVQRQHHGLVDN